MQIFSSSSVTRLLLLTGVLVGLPSAALAQKTSFPLTLNNCGSELVIKAPPERVATVGQATTEILYSLGLHNHVVGTSNWFTDVSEEFQQVDANIERIADNFPSFESIVSKRPDLVTADFLFSIGPQGVVAKREQFNSLGIDTYVLASQCINQDSSRGSDGIRTEAFKLDDLYQSIRDLSKVFDVQQKGKTLISNLQRRETAAIEMAAEQNTKDLSAVFWFSSADLGIDPWVAGRSGVPGWMLSTLSMKNIVESNEVWPMVGWESIAKANPDIIVIAKMERRRFEADDYQKKVDFLRNDPVTSHMDAVIHDRIVIMDAHAMDVTLRSIDGLEALSNAVKQLSFAGE